MEAQIADECIFVFGRVAQVFHLLLEAMPAIDERRRPLLLRRGLYLSESEKFFTIEVNESYKVGSSGARYWIPQIPARRPWESAIAMRNQERLGECLSHSRQSSGTNL